MRNIHSLLAMTYMFTGMMDHPEHSKRINTPNVRAPKTPLSNEERLLHMIKSREIILDKIKKYSSERSVCEVFIIQGYLIKAINIKNATKAIRSILGKCGFNPDITSKKYDLAILELERKINEIVQ